MIGADPLTWDEVNEQLPAYVGSILETVEDGIVRRAEFKRADYCTNNITFRVGLVNIRKPEGWEKDEGRHDLHFVTISLRNWKKVCQNGEVRVYPPAPKAFLLEDGRLVFSTYWWSENAVMIWLNATLYPPGVLQHVWVK